MYKFILNFLTVHILKALILLTLGTSLIVEETFNTPNIFSVKDNSLTQNNRYNKPLLLSQNNNIRFNIYSYPSAIPYLLQTIFFNKDEILQSQYNTQNNTNTVLPYYIDYKKSSLPYADINKIQLKRQVKTLSFYQEHIMYFDTS